MTLPTTRPSDEMTAKVIAAQNDLGAVIITTSTKGLRPIVELTPQGGPPVPVQDPRDCTDTALELLHWVCDTQPYEICIGQPDAGWEIYNIHGEAGYFYLPISGPPFRYAVVHLAAKVLGFVEGGE